MILEIIFCSFVVVIVVQWVQALKMMYMIFYLKVSTLLVSLILMLVSRDVFDIFLLGCQWSEVSQFSDEKVSNYSHKIW